MSSVILLKDHKENIQDGSGNRVVAGVKGDVVSVPFTVRNVMLFKRIADDFSNGVQVPTTPEWLSQWTSKGPPNRRELPSQGDKKK